MLLTLLFFSTLVTAKITSEAELLGERFSILSSVLKQYQWPKEEEMKQFHIGITGISERQFRQLKVIILANGLPKFRGKEINIYLIDETAFDPKQFQVIYVSAKRVDAVPRIAKYIRGTGTMLVSENSLAKKFTMINFPKFDWDKKPHNIRLHTNNDNIIKDGFKQISDKDSFTIEARTADKIVPRLKEAFEGVTDDLFLSENELKKKNQFLILAFIIIVIFTFLIIAIFRVNKARSLSNKKLKEALQSLEKISLTDQLTGAYNRRFLEKFFPIELEKLNRDQDIKPYSLQNDFGFILIDSDHFKHINDTYGHEAGDKVLIQFVEIFKKTCRESDWVIRWGGEEFLIVGRFSNRNELQVLAERIRINVESHQFDLGNERTIQRTCSFGLAKFPFIKEEINALTWEQTLNLADIALFAAKNNGRNAWVSLFEKDITEANEFYRHIQESMQIPIDLGLISIDTSITDRKLNFGDV